MIRANLGLAMQGLAVVPLFAGYDLDRRTGRIFSYDVTGGRYEEHDHHSVGSGSVFARGSLKKLWHPGLDADAAVRVAVEALVDAADDDSATGGPDDRAADLARRRDRDRGGLPARAGRGPRARPSEHRRADAGGTHAGRRDGGCAAMSMPFYVSPEQLMKDRADYARKGIARGRSVVVLQYDDGIAFATENPSRALHKVSEIYDRIALRGGRQVQRVREPAGRRRPVRRPARLLLRPRGRQRARARQRVRADARHGVHHRVQAARGRDRRRRGRREAGGRPDLPALLRRLRRPTSTASSSWAARPSSSAARSPSEWRAGLTLPEVLDLAVRALGRGGGAASRGLPAAQLEVAVLDRTRPRRAFRRLQGALLEDLLGAD